MFLYDQATWYYASDPPLNSIDSFFVFKQTTVFINEKSQEK